MFQKNIVLEPNTAFYYYFTQVCKQVLKVRLGPKPLYLTSALPDQTSHQFQLWNSLTEWFGLKKFNA